MGRPILFSGPMVRAILSGEKTQTRRVVKPIPFDWDACDVSWVACSTDRKTDGAFRFSRPDANGNTYTGNGREASEYRHCPYGHVGDRLWVRETWGYRGSCWHSDDPENGDLFIQYKADMFKHTFPQMPRGEWDRLSTQRPRRDDESDDERNDYLERYWAKWRPSIHMPRWASRITLDVTSVRVERLQDISENDARAEGVEPWPHAEQTTACDARPGPHRVGFGVLWDAINHKRAPWSSNPWVWVIGYEVPRG